MKYGRWKSSSAKAADSVSIQPTNQQWQGKTARQIEKMSDPIQAEINIRENASASTPTNENASSYALAEEPSGVKDVLRKDRALAAFLRDGEIPARERFVVWICTPDAERWPKTQAQLAKVLGVSPVTVSRWRHDGGFASSIANGAKQYVSGRVIELVKRIFTDAMDGDRHARDLIFRQILAWNQQVPQPIVNIENRLIATIGGKPAPPLPIGIMGRGEPGRSGFVGLLPQEEVERRAAEYGANA